MPKKFFIKISSINCACLAQCLSSALIANVKVKKVPQVCRPNTELLGEEEQARSSIHCLSQDTMNLRLHSADAHAWFDCPQERLSKARNL